MTATDDFDTIAPEADRDRYGRPLIIPLDGGKLEPYTRISTFASTLDDGQGLVNWKAQHVALGMARRPDLAALAAGLDYGNKALVEVMERAADAALLNLKADYGTAVHTFTEPDNLEHAPEAMRLDAQSYLDALDAHGLKVEATELFVVNDELKVAGTLDHIYSHLSEVVGDRTDDGVHHFIKRRYVGDKKTGSLHPLGFAVQLACYAGGSIYDAATGERTPLNVDLSTAILAHIPREKGTTDLYAVDIAAGLAGARLAYQVREFRKAAKTLSAAWPA